MDRILDKGSEVVLFSGGAEHSFRIKEVLGRGASCVVYKADRDDKTTHILKEYNPVSVNLVRGEDQSLSVADEEEREKYQSGLKRFLASAERQKDIRYSIDELTNSTSKTIEVIDEINKIKDEQLQKL